MAAKQPHKRPLPNGYISKGGKDAYEVHDNYQPTPHYMTSNPKAFHVRVHANNNQFEPAKVMTIATNKIKTFENFLEECTDKLKPPFGAARRLYTPSGRRRIQQLDQLHEDSIYVITGNEPFKRINYREIPDRLRPARHKRFKKIDIDRIYKVVQHAKDEHYRQKSGQCLRRNAQEQGLILEVSVNGRISKPWFQMCINSTSRNDIEKIKIAIQDTMQLNVIKKIYKVINCGGNSRNFIEITDPRDLNRFDHVLVVEVKEVLKPLLYRQDGLSQFHCPKSPRHIGLQGLFPPPEPVFPNKYSIVPSIGSSKQSDADTMSPLSNPPGSYGGRKTKRSKGHREVDYDKDEAGVFRAKKQNNSRGAHQVNDSKETRTEKPIDQMEAETVDEEEIHTKEKTTPIPPGTELNKQPSKETKQNAENASQTKTKAEVKKGGKSGKDINKVSVLPPIADGGGKKGNAEKVKRDDVKEIKEGHVKETVDNYEGKVGEGIGVNGPFVDEKEVTPKDLKTDDVIEITERELTPVEFQSKDVEVNKPPLSTTPPHSKLSQASGKLQEKVDENAAATKIQAGAKGYKARKDFAKMKEAKKREEENKRRQEKEAERFEEDLRQKEDEARNKEKKKIDEHEAATKIQAQFKGYKTRKAYKAGKQQVKQ